MRLATPLQRLGSYFIDWLIAFLITFPCNLVILTAESEILVVFFLLLTGTLNLGYLVVQIYFMTKGKSIGKHLTGLQVVNNLNREPLNFWKMLLRETIGKFISGFVFSLGYIWILIDDDNQAWHDKLVDSKVMDIK